MRCVYLLYICVAILGAVISRASTDTLRLPLREAIERVRSTSLSVRATRLEVSALDGEALQAGINPNPEFSAEVPLYTEGRRRWLDAGSGGQFSASVQQSISLTGLRGAKQRAAELRAAAASSESRQIEHSAVLSLKNAVITERYATLSMNAITKQLSFLDELIKGYDAQQKKGNVSLKDVMRLKSAYYSVNSERSTVLHEILESRRTLRQLLGPYDRIEITDVDSLFNATASPYLEGNLDQIIESALNKRSDVLAAKLTYEQLEAEARATRKQAVPEPSVGLSYDKAGSYSTNVFSVLLSIPLSVSDRNQGAIVAASARAERSFIEYEQVRRSAALNIKSALEFLQIVEREAAAVDVMFESESEQLTSGILENYRKGNISLLEFVDFYETYNESLVLINRLYTQRTAAIQHLHFLVGRNDE